MALTAQSGRQAVPDRVLGEKGSAAQAAEPSGRCDVRLRFYKAAPVTLAEVMGERQQKRAANSAYIDNIDNIEDIATLGTRAPSSRVRPRRLAMSHALSLAGGAAALGACAAMSRSSEASAASTRRPALVML